MNNFKDLLDYARKITNDTLAEVFDEVMVEAKNISDKLVALPYISKDYTLRGGKRLRAFLIMIGYWSKEWRRKDLDKLRYLMAGIEFLQSYFLVHDDIMDKDELRRGGPTVHVWFEKKCNEEKLLGDCKHYGISQAILAGDYLETLAVSSFYRLGLPGNIIEELLRRYTKGLRTVSYGQYLDLLIAYTPLEKVSEEDIYNIHKLKTASYTVELPLHLGAIASTLYTPKLLEELSSYAIPAGIAFQLQDDILGLYGDPKITGKPVGSDVREKKKTLLIVKAYELGSEREKRFLEKIYNEKRSEEITIDDIEEVRRIVRETGSYDYSVKKMQNYVNEAKTALHESEEICYEAKEVLSWLVDLFVKRVK